MLLHVEFSLDSLQECLAYENDRCETLLVVSAMVQPPCCHFQLAFSGFVFSTKLKIFQSETLSTLSKTVAFNTVHRSVGQVGYIMKRNTQTLSMKKSVIP